MPKSITHTKYRLQLGNPLRVYGIVRLVIGFILILIAITAFRILGPSAEWQGIAEELSVMLDQAEGRVSYGIRVFFTFIFAPVALLMGIVYFLNGLKYTARLYLPSKVPDDFENVNLLSGSIRGREILTYQSAPTTALRFLRTFFSEGVDYLPPSLRPIASANTRYLPLALFPVALIIIVNGAQEALQNIFEVSALTIPFPTTLLMLVLIIGAYRMFVTYQLIPQDIPSADFERTYQTLGGAGHPEALLAELELKSESFRYMDIPNRIYRRSDVELESEGGSDSGKIKGRIFFETQPIPEKQTHRMPGYLLLVGGAVFVPLGLYLLCFLPYDFRLSQFDEFALVYLPETFLHIIVGLVALRNGRRFFMDARIVLGRMLFRSDVFDIEFGGTFYKSEIGAGMARDDSLRSTSKAIRSEVIIRYYAANCISESVGFGKRDLLEATVDNSLKERIHTLKKAMEEHHDRGAKLVGIDFEGSKGIGQIANANIRLKATKDAASEHAKRSGTLPESLKKDDKLLSAGNVSENSEIKECPECAEVIKAKAKKCRFCGYRFDGENV